MPPFSPGAKGFLPNSTNSFWPTKPCQPSEVTEGGSMRPVEPPAPPPLGLLSRLSVVQSASAQYTVPGLRRVLSTGKASIVLARLAAMFAVPPPGVPSARPPAPYTTCTPVCLKRVVSVSITYQFNSGNLSLNPAQPFRSL